MNMWMQKRHSYFIISIKLELSTISHRSNMCSHLFNWLSCEVTLSSLETLEDEKTLAVFVERCLLHCYI